MNINEFRKIPIQDIVEKLGGQFIKDKGGRLQYTSPFRDEKAGSFYVYTNNNKWYDFGHTGTIQKGDGIDLVREFLGVKGVDNSVSDALGYFEGYKPEPIKNHLPKPDKSNIKENRLIIDQVRDSLSPSSVRYMSEIRGISNIGIIRANLKQVHFHFEKTPEKSLYAVGFENIKGGFELRAKASIEMKYAAGTKAVTHLKGSQANGKIDVFEGFTNYLTHLQRLGISQNVNDTLVLNAATLVNEGLDVVKNDNYNEVNVFKDNDVTGEKVLNAFKTGFDGSNAVVNDKSDLYKGFEDYNAMHVDSLKKNMAKKIA